MSDDREQLLEFFRSEGLGTLPALIAYRERLWAVLAERDMLKAQVDELRAERAVSEKDYIRGFEDAKRIYDEPWWLRWLVPAVMAALFMALWLLVKP